MKILLTGRNGQVGWELQRTLCILGDVVALGSAQLDLADPDAIVAAVRQLQPDLIVNAAAYTAVDRAETEPDLALAINGHAPGILAAEAKRSGAALVHYSTDYVFNGRKTGGYREDDATDPLNVYGRSKLFGEQAIAASGCRHLILRTSWVYGVRGRNFVLTMRRLLEERPEVAVVNDQVGAPAWSRWLAEATTFMLASRGVRELPSADGIYHLVPAGEVSWQGLATAIRDILHCPGEVRGIPSSDYPTPARRPANSVLSCAKVESGFGLHRPHWRTLLELCLEEVRSSAGASRA